MCKTVSEKLASMLEGRKEEYLQQLFRLLRQPSISAANIGMNECAELLRTMLTGLGFAVSVLPTEGHAVVYGEIIRDPKRFTVLFFGHYDVQPPEPLSAWLSPPFEPDIRDGRVYGRGAGDNKGQLMGIVLGIKHYLDAFGELPINVKLVLEGEEELGSTNLSAFVQQHRERLAADVVYTADGPMHDSGRPAVRLGARGMIYLELRAKGADVDNHSGNKGGVLPNPAWKLIDLLRTMRDEHGNVLVEGFYDHVRAPTEQDIRYIQRLPYDKEQFGRQAGFRDLDLDAEAYYRRLMLEPTFNICGFHSGYGGEGSKTIIPAEAVVKMDIRLVLDQTPQYVFDRFCAHVRRLAPDVEVRLLGSVKPSRTRPELPIVRTIVEAVGQCYREEPVVELSLGGTLPDYVWTELLGIPSVQVPYANYDEANHAPNENITLKHFYAGIRCTGHIIHALADYAKKGAADRAIPDWR